MKKIKRYFFFKYDKKMNLLYKKNYSFKKSLNESYTLLILISKLDVPPIIFCDYPPFISLFKILFNQILVYLIFINYFIYLFAIILMVDVRVIKF